MSTDIIPGASRKAGISAVEREFLPAALEIVETPASPSLRLTQILICAFFAVSVAWASVGKIDLVATAPGKVVPVGRTKQVQAFEPGTVRKILVDDGTEVKTGQVLVLLDPTLAIADRDRYRNQLMNADLDIARLTTLIASPAAGTDPFAGISASSETLAEARGQLDSERAEHDAKIAAAEKEIAEKRSEEASFEAEVAKIDAALPLVQQREAIRKESSEKGIGSRLDYIEAAQSAVELENQRKVMAAKLEAAQSAVQAQVADRMRISAEIEGGWRSDLQKAAKERTEATSELEKAEHRTGLTSVVAPVSGIVEELSVHTEGGVVQAGQQLLKVVPSKTAVTVEAVVENKDAGFVHVGQEAEIKVEAFPYTHYGLIKGRVEQVSKDSAPDPEALQEVHGGSQPLGDTTDNIRRSGALVYIARIAMDDPNLMVDGVRTPVEAGMAVTVEIKTGRQTVLDYLLSPVERHAHDALKER